LTSDTLKIKLKEKTLNKIISQKTLHNSLGKTKVEVLQEPEQIIYRVNTEEYIKNNTDIPIEDIKKVEEFLGETAMKVTDAGQTIGKEFFKNRGEEFADIKNVKVEYISPTGNAYSGGVIQNADETFDGYGHVHFEWKKEIEKKLLSNKDELNELLK
jgi:hypothetical protein